MRGYAPREVKELSIEQSLDARRLRTRRLRGQGWIRPRPVNKRVTRWEHRENRRVG